MEDDPETTYIDVREPMEFSAGHLKEAVKIPVGSISDGNIALQGIPKDSKLVVYCRSGARAENARTQLQQLGFADVVNGINQDNIEKSQPTI